MKEVDPRNFDPLAEARASPLTKAVFPILMFFLSAGTAVFAFGLEGDPFFSVFLVFLNLVLACYWIRVSYRNYMLHYWFQQLVFARERHKKHVGEGTSCTCMERMKRCILEYRRYC